MQPQETARAFALHNDAVAHARAGRHAEAVATLQRAMHEFGADRVDVRSLKALWQCALAAGDWPTGLAAGFAAGMRDWQDFPFAASVVRALEQWTGPSLPTPDDGHSPAARPTLSIVVVSQDDRRHAAVESELARAFAGWPHERIRVKGAASMYDGYARGLAQARGEWVVFPHDDIEIPVADFAARLARAMVGADMVGVAGTTRVAGPALLWAGHPFLHGAIAHRQSGEQACEFAVLSFAGPHVHGAQGLDGVFIAARRSLLATLGFDAPTLDGFHFYDLDLSYRAHLAGARIVIAADLGLVHASRGRYDDPWKVAQRAFAHRFPQLDAPPGAHRHFYAVPLPDKHAVGRMMAKLDVIHAHPLYREVLDGLPRGAA